MFLLKPVVLISIGIELIFLLSCSYRNKSKIVLETVTAMDERIPYPSKENMDKILKEAKHTISLKFGTDIELEFHDNGKISLEDLFQKVQTKKNHPELEKYKYDIALKEKSPVFSDPTYKKEVTKFLKSWSLESLKKFFPNTNISNYDDTFDQLLKMYHKKIKWLSTLKTQNGEGLLIYPQKSFQSYSDWKLFMFEQEQYDVIFTNTLIVLDTINTPYPHSVTKHAKVGGSSFESPKRSPMVGYSLLVNFLEEYGEINGLSNSKNIESSKKNKIIGGLFLAHEFGHAFFQIPDVYDHPKTCLMNASMDNGDMEKNYEILISDQKPCEMCRPWIQSKTHFINGENFFYEKKFEQAGNQFLQCAEKVPENFDGDRISYLKEVYRKAKNSYEKIGDKTKITEIKNLEKKLQ